MPIIDFPNNPVNGQVFNSPNGFLYTWDGTKAIWTALSGGSTVNPNPPFVTTPTIVSPTNGQTGVGSGAGITVLSSAFSSQNGAGTHASTDWQLSTSPSFASTVASVLASTSFLTYWEVAAPPVQPGTVYYVRARYSSTQGVVSQWSSAVTFTTAAFVTPSVQTPAITSPPDGETNVNPDADVVLVATPYVGTNGAGAHGSSDWQVFSNTGSTTANPESSAISSVGTGPNFGSGVSGGGSYNRNTFPEIFNNTSKDSTIWCESSAAPFVNWTFTTPITGVTSVTFVGTNNIYAANSAFSVNDSSAGFSSIVGTGEESTEYGGSFLFTFNSPSSTITSIGVGGNIGLYGVIVNGSLLFSNLPVLTFLNNTGLADMVVGDTVTEVGGGSNASGTITEINLSGPSIKVAPQSGNWTIGSTARDTSRTVTVPKSPLVSTNAITNVSGSTLTISAANSDGFIAGDIVSNGIAGIASASGTISTINGTSIVLSGVSGTWQVGQYVHRGQVVVDVVNDVVNKTSYTIPNAQVNPGATYYGRVRYKSVAPVTTSQWSLWSEFSTSASTL